MFQIRDNKVYQLIRFSPSSAVTIGIYSTRASAEHARDRKKASSTTNEECYFVIKDWQLDDVSVKDNLNTSSIYIYEEKITDTTPAKTNYICVVNGEHMLAEDTTQNMVFKDRVDAVCYGLLKVTPDNASFIEAKMLAWSEGNYALGDLSFIRENLAEFANTQNIVLTIE